MISLAIGRSVGSTHTGCVNVKAPEVSDTESQGLRVSGSQGPGAGITCVLHERLRPDSNSGCSWEQEEIPPPITVLSLGIINYIRLVNVMLSFPESACADGQTTRASSP